MHNEGHGHFERQLAERCLTEMINSLFLTLRRVGPYWRIFHSNVGQIKCLAVQFIAITDRPRIQWSKFFFQKAKFCKFCNVISNV